MDKASQIFIIKQRILKFLADMLEGEEDCIEKKTLLDFSAILQNFFSNPK